MNSGYNILELPPSCRAAAKRWRGCCATRRGTSRLTPATYGEIVQGYIETFRPGATAEMDFYRCLPTMQVAIDWAGSARRPDGKRHSHQQRITREALRRARDQLGPAKLDRNHTFDQLHAAIDDAIARIPGIGELTVYDTAIRVGAHLHLEPEVVYLHAGTRVGAQALGLPTKDGSLAMQNLPAAFRQLQPREVEDCLCIYKDVLATAN
jgi:hypothetical protein